MRRTQLQLDDATFQVLRRTAFDEGISMAALMRRIVDDYLGASRTQKRRLLTDFKFIGAGRSESSEFDPISERHDEALAEDFAR